MGAGAKPFFVLPIPSAHRSHILNVVLICNCLWALFRVPEQSYQSLLTLWASSDGIDLQIRGPLDLVP